MSLEGAVVRSITRLVVRAVGTEENGRAARHGPYTPLPSPATESRIDPAIAHTATEKVLQALLLGGDTADLVAFGHPDLMVWTPGLSGTHRDQVVPELGRSDLRDILSGIEITTSAYALALPLVFLEWRVRARFTGTCFVDDDLLIEPTGRPIELSGALVAQFRDDLVASVHLYYDDLALLEQLITS